MLLFQTFKGEEIGIGTSGVMARALDQANKAAAAWMGQYAEEIAVKFICATSVGLWACVTVWYEMTRDVPLRD